MEQDFEAVCTTNSVEEADMIVAWFEREGLTAHVKDRNTVGTLTWGTPAVAPRGIEVVVAPPDAQRARELWLSREHAESASDAPHPATVESVCEECGKSASYPYEMRGKVETCPHCNAYVDVSGGDDEDESESDDV